MLRHAEMRSEGCPEFRWERPSKQWGKQMETGASVAAHIIQLAVAPVFLLSGIAGLLAVMTTRLGRVIDRARAIHASYHGAGETLRRDLDQELAVLSRRSKVINLAVTLVTICALLVCSVIAGLFLGEFLGFDSSVFIGWTFILAMASLITGLLIFLREIDLAMRTVRFDLPKQS